MQYVLEEDKKIIGVLNYAPNVPSTVTVHEVEDVVYQSVITGTHYFDLTEKKVLPIPKEAENHRLKVLAKTNGTAYLAATDWKVLRHWRETTLGVEHTLSPKEFLALETERAKVASRISS